MHSGVPKSPTKELQKDQTRETEGEDDQRNDTRRFPRTEGHEFLLLKGPTKVSTTKER